MSVQRREADRSGDRCLLEFRFSPLDYAGTQAGDEREFMSHPVSVER